MKEISELNLPEDVRYTEDHEWAKLDGDIATIGISDYAQDQLGDIVFVEMPEMGSSYDKGEEFGSVESVKAVSELYMPLGGEVVEINPELEDAPEQVNSDPYGGGWMLKVKVADTAEFDALMDKEAYLESLKG
jgi:glycine cleavage system H protein